MPRRNLRAAKLSDKDLDRLATITDADVESARASWHREAPDKFKNLLDTPPQPAPDA